MSSRCSSPHELGHRSLFEREIIHRDVSVLNILMGVAGPPEGYRGILIDLDMAAYTEDRKSSLPSDPRTVLISSNIPSLLR